VQVEQKNAEQAASEATGSGSSDFIGWKLQTLLAEYARLKDEIFSHKASQQTILNFIIALAAAELAALTRLPWGPAGWLSLEGLLLLPIPFGLLGMYHSGYTMRIHKLGRCIDGELRVKLESIAGSGTLRTESYLPISSPLGLRKAQVDGRLVYLSLLGLKAFPQVLPLVTYCALKTGACNGGSCRLWH
jgi:hypothetical protein